MMFGIGEARLALLAVGHCRAQQDSIQGGPLGPVVFAAAAIRATAQSTVRVIYGFYLRGSFRLGTLFGHLWNPFLLRGAGYSFRGLHHFQWFRIFFTTPGIEEARPAPLAAGHLWAQQDVFQGGALGTVVFRAAASRTAVQSMVRRIRAGDLYGNFPLVVLLGHYWSSFLLRRAGYCCHVLPRFYWVRGSMTMLGIREVRPALLAVGHPWDGKDSFQGGVPRKVALGVAASRAAGQFAAQGICRGYLLGYFRLGVRIFLTTPGIEEGQPAVLAVGHVLAPQDPSQGGAPGRVVLRAAANRAAGQFALRGICRGYLLGNSRLVVLLDIS